MRKVMYRSDDSYVSCRAGVYYYIRRVPYDVRQHYASNRLSFSLKTKSYAGALRAAQSVTQRLEDYWLGLRLQDMDIPAIHLVRTNHEDNSSPVMLVIRAAKRNGRYVSEALGNRPITSYSSSDAAAFRDYLFGKGLALGSVKRIFGSVRSIINLVMLEHGIEGTNGFAKTYMPERDDSQDRQPIPQDKLVQLQQACMREDDEMRWLLALISDTGMRLAEAAGLHKDDIILDAPIPYINLQPHSWRRLKTRGSARHIPLIGVSLWAARRIQQHDSSYAFPHYCDGRICNANSASAALNKWMKTAIGNGYVMHGLRHSLRDRLRAVECPSDIIDAIGGDYNRHWSCLWQRLYRGDNG